ncbi:hypothetical protein B484DRAFT_448484 [Ochromonadaceae sp. CCMP2298]|nr:hypothetical protein B484DRAFT_448484 [Ochromonadaceae sp. CCMP2298]
MEMDQYWFKAGKGPDPTLKNLDNDMDEYFKTKAAQKAAALIPTEIAVEAVMEAVEEAV